MLAYLSDNPFAEKADRLSAGFVGGRATMCIV